MFEVRHRPLAGPPLRVFVSSTNRGAKRIPQDLYETPEWLIRAMLPHLEAQLKGQILEPAEGNGAIVRTLEEPFPAARIVQGDIQTGQNFLSGQFDLIITNSPYSLALEFIQRALQLRAKGGAVAMLFQLNFLGSQQGASFWRSHTPSGLTSRRPDFTGDGGDSIEYAWFTWDAVARTKRGNLQMLNILVAILVATIAELISIK
jgi:hypothetical protein